MRYRAEIAKHHKSHKAYLRRMKKKIPKRLFASGLAPHLVELLQKHKEKADAQANQAQKKDPEKDVANAAVQGQQGKVLKASTDQKFKTKKIDLMSSIRGFSKKDLSDVKKRKLADRKKEVTALSQIRDFNKKKMKKAAQRVLKPKPKRGPNILDDIKKGRKLKKVFRKEANRKDHLRRLREDKDYYAANYKFRREKYAKR